MGLRILAALAAILVVCSAQESGESETLRFVYEAHTNMMLITRQAVCYIFTLTTAEQAQVHSSDALRILELKLLGMLGDPNLVMHPLPENLIHTSLHRECGKGILKYYAIDQAATTA